MTCSGECISILILKLVKVFLEDFFLKKQLFEDQKKILDFQGVVIPILL